MSSTIVEVSNPTGNTTVEVSNPSGTTYIVEVAPIGATGRAGLSAYQIALQHGFTGTEEQWLQSLHGPGFIVLGPNETTPPPGTPINTIVFQDRNV